MNLRQISISKRLGLAFGLVLMLVLGMAAVATLMLRDIKQLGEAELRLDSQLQLAKEWQGLTELNLDRTNALLKAGESGALREHLSPLMKGTSGKISGLREQIEALATDDASKAKLKEIDARRKDYIGLRDSLFARIKAGEAEAVRSESERLVTPAVKAYSDSLQALQQHLSDRVAQQRAAQARATDSARNLLWAIALVAVLAGAALSWFITQSVLNPVRDAIAASRRVADGDLSQPMQVHGRDELTQLATSINGMTHQLSGSLNGVLQASGLIQSASSEIASGSSDLSTRTEQAASSLQQTASSLEQLTGTVGHSAASAREAAALATSAADVAERGGAAVEQVVSTMQAINEASRRIADIIGTIDGIAFQTNILALNAAVEAARAGEQGRGFAVVASEVRSLAQRSAQAAREIKALIGASVERVETGSVQVADAGETMREIVSSVQRVKDIIAEISSATGEQSSGIGAVNGAVTDIDRVTQQNAALVEQSAAAAESLKDQAVRLTQLVAGFKLQRA